MAVCFKINDTQTECCNPLTDTCSISGEGPFPTGPVGVDGKALSQFVSDVVQGLKNLLSGEKGESVRKPEAK